MKLDDLLVIETGPGLAGPLVTRILADFGARVLKIESRAKLDFGKTRLPPPGKTAEDVLENQGVLEMCGGKESVTLNLKTESGLGLFADLVGRADVYVESYAPGWLERLGLSTAKFLAANPRLIVLSESAYGGEGPMRDQRAYAQVMTAVSGVESTVGYPDGRIVPQIASAVGDVVAAYFGIFHVLGALHERELTGRGQIIDESQTEASSAMASVAFAEFGLSERIPGPVGSASPLTAPHGVYRTAGDDDQWISIAVWSDDEWGRLCGALHIADTDRDRYAELVDRLAARDAIDALVGAATVTRRRDALTDDLQAAGISCAPVLSTLEADEHAVLTGRDFWSESVHPRVGMLRMTEIPWRFDRMDLRRRAWAEPLGTSTESVLKELLGAGPERIRELREEGALT